MAAFGHLTLLISLVVATFAGVTSLVGIRRSSERLLAAGRAAVYLLAAMLSLAIATMAHAFASGDYAIKYVQHYSEAAQPFAYKLTAVWGGLDGSMLFWVFLLAICAAISVRPIARKEPAISAYGIVVLMAICDFFIYLVVFEKNPFDTFLLSRPDNGQGLNPLLQNMYMVAHPPSLYMGFVALTIPFAYAMGNLWANRPVTLWWPMVKRWLLGAWFMLALGLTLGMIWAYEVLGWGGFWAWDPVENAGLLPFLTATALIHSGKVQERRGIFYRWNLTLVILSFFLTIFGTFMTRSGIVQSVHAFGKDLHLAWIFGGFMIVILLFSFGLLFYRWESTRPKEPMGTYLSREAMFLFGNWFFVLAMTVVLSATMFPTLSEAFLGERKDIGVSFFNQWMVPIGIALLLLTGTGALFTWRGMENTVARRRALLPISLGIVTLIAGFAILGTKSPAAVMCFATCAFVTTIIGQELVRGTRARQRTHGGSFPVAMAGLIFRARQPHAGYIVHLGVVLMFLGFAGQAFQREETAVIGTGESTNFAGYTLRFDGIARENNALRETYRADIHVSENGKALGRMQPGRLFYHQRPNEPMSEVAIHRDIDEDLYLTFGSYDQDRRTLALKMVTNPLVDWMWLGFMVMAFGSLLILLTGHHSEQEQSVSRWVPILVSTGAAVIVTFLGKTVLHLPLELPLLTLALCGLTIGVAGLACYRVLEALLLPRQPTSS